jgi:MFS family permease
MNVTENYRWNILWLATFCMLTFAVIFQSIPPILRILVDDLHITYAKAGALMGLFTLPSIVLALPGGILVDRFGSRNIGIVSLLTITLGTIIVALGTSYWIIGFGRLVTGVGAAILVVVIPKVITSWFYDREIGLSMGIFNTAMPLGTILSLNFMGVIAHRFNWQTSIWTGFALSVTALFLFLLFYRSKEGDEDTSSHSSGLSKVLREAGWRIWLVGLSWALCNAGLISFFTYSPDYFVSQGADISRAGLLASYPMWGSIVLAPVIGLLVDRVGRKWLFVSAGCVGIAVLLFLIPRFPNHVALLSISIGFFVAILAPAIFSFPAELLRGPVMGFGFGILAMAVGIGMSVGPYLVGSLRDATGNYAWSFATMAIFCGMGILPMIILKMKEGEILS